MQKINFLAIFGTAVFLSGCVSQSEYNELESEVTDLEDTIENCNSQIQEAQSYAGASYEEMEDALNNLTECRY